MAIANPIKSPNGIPKRPSLVIGLSFEQREKGRPAGTRRAIASIPGACIGMNACPQLIRRTQGSQTDGAGDRKVHDLDDQ
jgi:hypothetical protein